MGKIIRIRYVWTRIFLQTEGKNLRFQNYPDTCWWGVKITFTTNGKRQIQVESKFIK